MLCILDCALTVSFKHRETSATKNNTKNSTANLNKVRSRVRDLPTQNYPTRSPAQKTNDRPVMTKSKDKYQDDYDNNQLSIQI